jgi:hypothetical protein
MATILPIVQPIPIETRIAHLRNAAGWMTALYRRWRPGDSRLCHLCPRGECCAEEDACLLLVPVRVSEIEAARFSTVGLVGRDDLPLADPPRRLVGQFPNAIVAREECPEEL